MKIAHDLRNGIYIAGASGIALLKSGILIMKSISYSWLWSSNLRLQTTEASSGNRCSNSFHTNRSEGSAKIGSVGKERPVMGPVSMALTIQARKQNLPPMSLPPDIFSIAQEISHKPSGRLSANRLALRTRWSRRKSCSSIFIHIRQRSYKHKPIWLFWHRVE